MKKVLFGILALSMAAFAANPGTGDTSASAASVPVEVTATIIKAPTGLTITDEAGKVLDKLVIDHGQMVQGKATNDSVASQLFKVQKFDENGNNVALLSDVTNNETKLHAELQFVGEGNTTTLKNLSDSTSTLASTLSLSGGSNPIDSISYDHALAATDTVHTGRVTSTIAKASLNAGKPGIHNNGDNRPTLSVTLVP